MDFYNQFTSVICSPFWMPSVSFLSTIWASMEVSFQKEKRSSILSLFSSVPQIWLCLSWFKAYVKHHRTPVIHGHTILLTCSLSLRPNNHLSFASSFLGFTIINNIPFLISSTWPFLKDIHSLYSLYIHWHLFLI